MGRTQLTGANVKDNSLEINNETTGTLALSRGGTGADLSATGGANRLVKQSTSGGPLTVSVLANADLPTCFRDYISGLAIYWVSTVEISISGGAAAVAATGRILEHSSSATFLPPRVANTCYYIYLCDSGNGNSASIEFSTTAPAAPYWGTARSKTGDTSRRYIGSYATNTSGNIVSFVRSDNRVLFRGNLEGAPFRVVNGLTDITRQAVSLSAIVPSSARVAIIRIFTTTTVFLRTSNSEDGLAGSNASGIGLITSTSPGVIQEQLLDASRAFQWWFNSTPSGAAWIDLLGYIDER